MQNNQEIEFQQVINPNMDGDVVDVRKKLFSEVTHQIELEQKPTVQEVIFRYGVNLGAALKEELSDKDIQYER